MRSRPPSPMPETAKQRARRLREDQRQQCLEKLCQDIKNYRTALQDMPNATPCREKTLFVGRLGYNTTTVTLVKEFGLFGELEDVRIVTDKKGRPRGYAFIQFSSVESLKKALESCKGKVIDGREVVVDAERGRNETGWIPRRLGGGVGGTDRLSKEIIKTLRNRRRRKRRKARARQAKKEKNATGDSGIEEYSENESSDQNQVANNISPRLEVVSLAGNSSQGMIGIPQRTNYLASRAVVQPFESSTNTGAESDVPVYHLWPVSGNLVQGSSSFISQSTERSNAYAACGGNFNQPTIYRTENHPASSLHQPDHQIPSTFGHQSSATLPQNYVGRVILADGARVRQPNQNVLQSHQICNRSFETHQFQQIDSNPASFQGNSNAASTNYHIQPVTVTLPQSYFNLSPQNNLPYQFNPRIPPPVFRNSSMPTQSHQILRTNTLISQPAEQNFNYPPPNSSQSISHLTSVFRENYQAPSVTHQVQQSVPQISSQLYWNYGDERENYQIQQPRSQISYSANEDHNVTLVRNEVPPTNSIHIAENVEFANAPPRSNNLPTFNPYLRY